MSESFTITLPDGARFSAAPAENLLSAAQRAHWLVRYGCRNGNCLACVAQLRAGSVLQRDVPIADGEILLCLCTARSDLQIELPGNPQHGSAEQARRGYARLERIEIAAAQTVLHFQLPAGRQPPLYPGQYALIETDAGIVRGEIDSARSRSRDLALLVDAAPPMTRGAHCYVRYPLGYRYAKESDAGAVLILARTPQSPAALLLQRALPAATTLAIDAVASVADRHFAGVLACAESEAEAARWYAALLAANIHFDEFRSDETIRYRWRVLRQDDNGNRFTMAEGLSEDAARAQATLFEQRGHKQLYWAEPMSA